MSLALHPEIELSGPQRLHDERPAAASPLGPGPAVGYGGFRTRAGLRLQVAGQMPQHKVDGMRGPALDWRLQTASGGAVAAAQGRRRAWTSSSVALVLPLPCPAPSPCEDCSGLAMTPLWTWHPSGRERTCARPVPDVHAVIPPAALEATHEGRAGHDGRPQLLRTQGQVHVQQDQLVGLCSLQLCPLHGRGRLPGARRSDVLEVVALHACRL